MKIKIKTTRERVFDDIPSHSAFLNGAICFGIHHETKGDSGLLIAYLKKYRPSLTLTGYANDDVITLMCSGLCKMTADDRYSLLKFIVSDYKDLDINKVNSHGLPALYYAVSVGNISILNLLFSAGADIQQTAQALATMSTLSVSSPRKVRLNPGSKEVEALLKETLYSQVTQKK